MPPNDSVFYLFDVETHFFLLVIILSAFGQKPSFTMNGLRR